MKCQGYRWKNLALDSNQLIELQKEDSTELLLPRDFRRVFGGMLEPLASKHPLTESAGLVFERK